MISYLRNKNDKVHEIKNIQKELKMQGSMPSLQIENEYCKAQCRAGNA